MDIRDYKTAAARRSALENELKIDLTHVGLYSLDEAQASTSNCENMIGAVQVPVGIAGPLKIVSSQFSILSSYVPLATTEGALVASVSRGCKAITESGGACLVSKRIGITRAPVFAVKNVSEGAEFIIQVENHFEIFKKIAEETSSHLKLLHIRPWMVGRNVYLRFTFDSQDAMGMNMATIATSNVASHIEEKTGIQLVAVSGNMCVDKKANTLNFIEGRGISVWADIQIPKEILTSVLKTTAKKFEEVVQRKLVYGSIMSGSLGSNAHMANILAALFLATGQDVAHVAECSTGVTTAEALENGNLYVSVYLPDLVIGTVGGGTGLATQKESLSILKLYGGNEGKNAQKFAEIIGGTVLAGELSLLASLAEGTLAEAHQRLGRGGK